MSAWVAESLLRRQLPNVGKRIRPRDEDTREELLSLLRNRIMRQVKVIRTRECIEFPAINDDGYGRIKWGHSRIGAHRAAYMVFVGDVPDGLVIDHGCRNHGCINPDHLEPVTNKENVLRGIGITALSARATHCKRGHEFNTANTRINRAGGRECRACARLKWHRLKNQRINRIAAEFGVEVDQ